MTRQRFAMLLDFLISAAGWGIIVFLLGLPVTVVVAFCITLIPDRPTPLVSGEPTLLAQLRADGSPVFREVADGKIAANDSVDALIAAHPPDLILVLRSEIVCCYRGGAGKDVRSLLILTQDDRLVVGIVLATTTKRERGYLLGGLPLTAHRDEADVCPECPSLVRIEYRQGLLGVTGGIGVVSAETIDVVQRAAGMGRTPTARSVGSENNHPLTPAARPAYKTELGYRPPLTIWSFGS